MASKRDEIKTRIELGDTVIVALKRIDDRETAEILTGYIWDGIDD